jgi:type IV secretion system protein VirB9
VEPERTSYFNAIQQYAYTDGALFQIYTAPGQITDIMLQEGEELVGPGPVASGDTVRWIIGDTVSGAGAARRVHILVKPTRADIRTNLIINTNRRTYHLELSATNSTYMAAVSWTYPQDALIALRTAEAERERTAPVASGIDFSGLNFRYRIGGDHPGWRPVRVFDDGRQVFIEFPGDIASSDMPPLFVIGADQAAELVNYRVQGRYMVVDRLFERAELRLGAGNSAKQVRIERERARRRSRS